ncbi:MAG TPA: hypothetical protein VLB27_03720, partial [candidate division Zixibacteria bacterium]|nr:hypothetical protein [candidate division Zixibacteria bacterium]
MTELPENHPDLNRYPVYDARRPDDLPLQPTAEPEFHIREPYRTSTLSWFTLTLLVIWPLSNLIVTGDPGEMIRQMGDEPATFY